MTAPDTSVASHVPSGGDVNNYRYLAPEIQWPDDGETDQIQITAQSDVYGMGMVAYEVSDHLVISPQASNLTFIPRS